MKRQIGICGLGNYAGDVVRVLERMESQPDSPARLAAVCEPDLTTHADAAKRLRDRGVLVVSRYEDLLDMPIDAVWLPLPIHLHRSYTEQALAAGKAVLCEKPAAGCVQDVDAMIAARDAANLPVLIGFQEIYDPHIAAVKCALVDGLIGRIKSITVHSGWPRGYSGAGSRSAWAGRMKQGDSWVMDSVAMNAEAHGIAIALYLAGSESAIAATPVSVEAELYRTNPIETFDTISMRLRLDTGASMLVIQSHACESRMHRMVTIEGERGRLFHTREVLVVESPSGTEVRRLSADTRPCMVEALAQQLQGENISSRSIATLETARSHVLAVNGASAATHVHDITHADTWAVPTRGGSCQVIAGLDSLSALAIRRGTMLHESGLFTWTHPAETLDLRSFTSFNGVIRSTE